MLAPVSQLVFILPLPRSDEKQNSFQNNWRARNGDLFQDSAMQRNHLESTQPPKKSQNLSGRESDEFTSNFCFFTDSAKKKYCTNKCLYFLCILFMSLFCVHYLMVIMVIIVRVKRDCSYLQADMDGWLPLPSESHCHTTVTIMYSSCNSTAILYDV